MQIHPPTPIYSLKTSNQLFFLFREIADTVIIPIHSSFLIALQALKPASIPPSLFGDVLEIIFQGPSNQGYWVSSNWDILVLNGIVIAMLRSGQSLDRLLLVHVSMIMSTLFGMLGCELERPELTTTFGRDRSQRAPGDFGANSTFTRTDSPHHHPKSIFVPQSWSGTSARLTFRLNPSR